MPDLHPDTARRIAIARDILCDGGSLSDVAFAWGVSVPRVHVVLKKNDEALLAMAKDNVYSRMAMKEEEVLLRLQRIKDYGSSKAAKIEGVSPSAISSWLARHCGGLAHIDEAIEDISALVMSDEAFFAAMDRGEI
jgi:hypothetical protein